MEKIKERSMTTFILSTLLNTGIGLLFGLLVGIIVAIADPGFYDPAIIIFVIAGGTAAFVTLFAQNMYRTYFYYRLSMDVNAVCKGDGKETDSYLLAFVFNMLTLGLYNVYWVYKIGQRLHVNAPRYGFKMMETGKDIAVLQLFSFGYISAWELMRNMNRIAKVYNQSGVAEVVGGVQ